MRILLLCALVAAACASSWNYDSSSSNGPSNWPDECVLSTSLSQSPIDINTSNVSSASYPSFSFSGYSNVDVELTNNGHTVQATLKPYGNATLTGGGLSGTYKLAQFHLHWGSINSQGSEHKLDGTQYAMEVHFVHYDTQYANLNAALDKTDGLAVLAWFFVIDDDNSDWNIIFNELPLAEGLTVNISAVILTDLMGTVGNFYRYDGSLTTPPCYETVIWTVFQDVIDIDQSQIDIMRSVVDSSGSPIEDNFRPTQPHNGRTVYDA